MAKLKNVHNIVLKLLQENEELRSDDFMLLSAVYGLQVAVDQLPFSTICQHHVDLGLPSFETVRRTRQKVQSQHPELVDEKMKSIRAAEQDEFHDYSKKSAEKLEMPKKYKLSEIIRQNKVAIHTPTEAKANALLEALDELGYEWRSGKILTSYNYYETYMENTCYVTDTNNIEFCALTFYKGERYQIIEFDDIDLND